MLQALRDTLEALLGLGLEANEIDASQMALRAIVVYAFTLALVRLGSKRFLGKATAFDIILAIIIGSVMSRAVNGSADLVPTLAGGAALIAMHAIFAALSYRTHRFGIFVKGEPILLIEDGRVCEDAMRKASLSQRDLVEALRLKGHEPDPSRIRHAYLERNGSISVLPREEGPRIVEISVAEGVQTVRIELH